jgi:hypothetical protein
MKNTQGQNYEFTEAQPHHWYLIGEPTLQTIVKDNALVTTNTTAVDVVNYSGGLSISAGNTIYGQIITQINYVNGVVEYVTL